MNSTCTAIQADTCG